MASDYDVVVIGAGAAGIAAASALGGSQRSVLLVEARDRIGGRAHSVEAAPGLAVDEGCGWLHSADRNPLVALAAAAGFTIDRTPPSWGTQYAELGFSRAEQEAFGEAFDAFETRVQEAAARGEDKRASDCFDPGGRWNALMDAVSSYYNGCEFDRVSTLDYDAYADSGVNWRVREGYGTALASLGQGLDLRLACPVTEISHTGTGLRVSTPSGDIQARRAIVTVPTPHLAEERLVLPRSHRAVVEAAAALPLGLANKVFLALAHPEILPKDGHLFGRTDRVATASYHLRPFGRPYIEAFLGGRHANTLENEGKGAPTAFVIEELGALLGADVVRSLSPLGETAWGRDPLALGSYSHALPGHASARAKLVEPVDDRIVLAGEATHATAFSTAHGAWESGLSAARRTATSLAASRSSKG